MGGGRGDSGEGALTENSTFGFEAFVAQLLLVDVVVADDAGEALGLLSSVGDALVCFFGGLLEVVLPGAEAICGRLDG